MKKLILAPIIVLAVVVLVVFGLKNVSSDHFQPFPAEEFAKNPEKFRGNTYSLKGIIDLQLAQNENGRIIAVKYYDSPGRVSVYVPPNVDRNFEIGQRYEMAVRVKDNMLYVEDLEKF